jgi:hypothetical protein
MVLQRNAKALSVSQPLGFAEAFKRLARERTDTTGGRVTTAQDLHEEALRSFLNKIRRGKRVVFVAIPHKKKKRTTMWFHPELLADVTKVANCRNVSHATVVLTACLEYLQARGIELH